MTDTEHRERIEDHLTVGAAFRNPQGVEVTITNRIKTVNHRDVLGAIWGAKCAAGRFVSPMAVTIDGLVSCGYEPIEVADQ